MERTQRFSALYNRDFRLFWFGQIVSLSGTWMHSVAQSWLVYSISKSPLQLGIVASLASLPILLFTLFGGMVADRYPRRSILLVTQTLSIIPAAVLGFLTEWQSIAVWQVGLIAFLFGTINAFDIPARQAFLAEVAGKSDITSAIALNSAAFNGARIIGPVLAGFIIAQISIPACFFLNAISFVPVIFALRRISITGAPKRAQAGFVEGIADGWAYVRNERRIMSILSLIGVFSLFGIPYITLLPVLAVEVYDVGVQGLSLLAAAAGIGSLTAAVAIAFRGEVDGKHHFLPIAAMVFSVAVFAVSLTRSYAASLLFVFLAGWGIVSFLAVSNSYIQHAVPDALRGRVMSLYTLVFLGFAPLGNSAIGFVAEAIGAMPSLRIFAGVCVFFSLAFFVQFRRHAREAAA
jgi:MFS family permease